MKRLVIVACLAAGCDGIFDLEPVKLDPDAGGSDDAGADGGPLACYGGNAGGFLTICLQPGDDDAWTPPTEIDTGLISGECELVIPHDGRDLCVIAAQNIAITQQITARGGKPVVLVATQTLMMNGSLLASSTLGRRGPGANPPVCVPGNAPVATAAGAAGGTHGTAGGDGGAADNGAGGIAQAVSESPVTTLRGGCRGGDTPAGSVGGDGGGAVYLIAGGVILLNGATIDASGEKGRGGALSLGGGGGGAGGMIVLDAPMIAISGSIFVANGGGGGGGGGTNDKGEDGQERNLGLTDYAALGGAGGVLGGGAGGGGADLDSEAVNGEDGGELTAGGGGGGGGHGRILLFGITAIDESTVFSPPMP